MNVQPLERLTPATDLAVVLCGTFRRDPQGLADIHRRLSQSYHLLAPRSVDFVEPDADFVRLAGELQEPVAAVEERHLNALRRADFVWLHAPDGYVGTSASMEIGHARALGIPIFTATPLRDETLAAYVTVVPDTESVPGQLQVSPGTGLTGLQQYYGRVSRRRGWMDESPRDTLLLLTEEFGELARAIRKQLGLRRDGAYPTSDVAQELADVQLYLVHLANNLGVDLAEAVTQKEAVNKRKFDDERKFEVA